MQESILILDFGSQDTFLIARRLRERGFFAQIQPCSLSLLNLERGCSNLKGIILSGSPYSVTEPNAPTLDPIILELNIPVLGLCYGMQLLSHFHGGNVFASSHKEYGTASLKVLKRDSLFAKLPKNFQVWMSHGDKLHDVPAGFEVLAHSENSAIAAMKHISKPLYALQFHPEVSHTEYGSHILNNFAVLCGMTQQWSMGNFIETQIQKIRQQVKEGGDVLCGLSGGVDSTVCAFLLSKAIGKRVKCVMVDTGLLRAGEVEEVQHALSSLDIHVVDAKDKFYQALSGITDPEQKRKIIGRLFFEVFEEKALSLPGASAEPTPAEAGVAISYLAQGTLYPDVIESVSDKGPSATIKSHHNVGGLPEKMNLKLIEPLRELFKDEVRRVGIELGLSSALVGRHPFPGPGLAIRILGEVTQEAVLILQKADKIYLEEIRKSGLYDEIWQAFAVLLPVKSVGVMGDCRTYDNVVAIRAVTSVDGMTADWYRFPPEILQKISSRIINEVQGVNRVVYDISSKPPATIEWE